jgi:hypothetical protein
LRRSSNRLDSLLLLRICSYDSQLQLIKQLQLENQELKTGIRSRDEQILQLQRELKQALATKRKGKKAGTENPEDQTVDDVLLRIGRGYSILHNWFFDRKSVFGKPNPLAGSKKKYWQLPLEDQEAGLVYTLLQPSILFVDSIELDSTVGDTVSTWAEHVQIDLRLTIVTVLCTCDLL